MTRQRQWTKQGQISENLRIVYPDEPSPMPPIFRDLVEQIGRKLDQSDSAPLLEHQRDPGTEDGHRDL